MPASDFFCHKSGAAVPTEQEIPGACGCSRRESRAPKDGSLCEAGEGTLGALQKEKLAVLDQILGKQGIPRIEQPEGGARVKAREKNIKEQ